MTSIEPLWTTQQLEDLVHALAKDSAKVVITMHCQERMAQRGISAIEVLRCLRRGLIQRKPIYNKAKCSYELRMSEPAPRDVICVVAAINPTPPPDKLFAVTVWEI
jgi:hypothetical protein